MKSENFKIISDEKEIGENVKKINLYDKFLKDLFEIRNPGFYKKADEEKFARFKEDILNDKKHAGVWAYYPWLNTAYFCPPEELYFEVFTSRNRPLIPDEEQKKFYNFKIGIIGLSVGQSVALTLARTGGAKNIKIADPDTIDPSNLNRIHFGLPEIGKLKTEVVTQKLLEINPFLNIQTYDDGLDEKNCEDFITKDFKLDLIVDACDSFPVKIMIRNLAQKHKIPVLMATDVGDGTLLDIERYDLDPNLELFGGRLKLIKEDDDFMKKGLKIISPENLPLPLLEGIFEVGGSVPTHPQLATSAFFSGVILSYAIRRIANKKEIMDKRHYIDLEELLDPRYQDEKFQEYKKNKVMELKKYLGI